MGLNMKNDETHRLAEDRALHPGGRTAAATTAIRERFEWVNRERGKSLAEQLLAIGRAPRLNEPYRAIDPAELLLDERGMPRCSSILRITWS